MNNQNNNTTNNNTTSHHKLSLWRVLLLIIIITTLTSGSIVGIKWWKSEQTTISNKPWFASYIDVTATPTFPFQQLGETNNKDAILSFIVSLPSNACTPSWGGAYTLDQANNALDLDTRIGRLQQLGGSIAISFGGLNNSELAIGCTDPNALLNAYSTVINRYNIDTIDLDLEGAGLTNINANVRRATAIAKLQSSQRAKGEKLAVWVTLPVTPQGLTQDGTNEVSQLLSNKVDISGVNVMTMDYGSSLAGQKMLSASENALIQTERQLGILYKDNNIYLNDATLWAKMGVTPMIGQNDDYDEIFTLDDAVNLNKFMHAKGGNRISMWSANRDMACGSNYLNVRVVSDSCSGVQESQNSFSKALGNGFDGNISLSAGLVTESNANLKDLNLPDNPAQSPYQIWSETGSYLEKTKVVWHHNIYIAKWWTQGDLPDNPVLQSWQTPWELIGPVLPGETPIPRPTLPAGTYPNWSGTSIYISGQRVLLNGIPYQAKWWNQGNSPEASTSDPNGSPWAPLTQDQINALKNK